MAQIRLDLDEADGNLPAVCMCCGAPASIFVVRKMSWFPRWSFWFFLIHPFLGLLVAALVHRRARVRVPLCARHQRHWFNRRALIWLAGLLLGSLAAAAFATASLAADHIDGRGFGDHVLYAALTGAGALVLWLIIIWIVQRTEIRPSVITKKEIVLTDVSEAFVKAVQDADRGRVERMRNNENWSASKPRAPADAIQAEHARQTPTSPDGIEE